MTLQELCDLQGVELCLFDGSGWHSKGFYNPATNIIAIDLNMSEIEQKKVALHELGHKEHSSNQYNRRREQYEVQADKNMIHHLLKEELSTYEDVRDFNYVHFMEKYDLKTIANEAMVIEEYYSLIDCERDYL